MKRDSWKAAALPVILAAMSTAGTAAAGEGLSLRRALLSQFNWPRPPYSLFGCHQGAGRVGSNMRRTAEDLNLCYPYQLFFGSYYLLTHLAPTDTFYRIL